MAEINEKDVDFLYVFSSNIWLILKNLGLGVFTLSVYALAIYLQNVLSLGILGNALIYNKQPLLFYKMIPHGLLEIFGIVLSVTAILYCLYSFVRAIPPIVKRQVRVSDVLAKLVTFLCAILFLEITLFIVAGIIEVFVSWFKVM